MRFLFIFLLNFSSANFGASQDEMDLFDLGNDFRSTIQKDQKSLFLIHEGCQNASKWLRQR